MKMIETIPMFILVFTGYLCNALDNGTTSQNWTSYTETPYVLSSTTADGRRLRTLVVAGVSIALVLLFILIVAGFWYARKKSQEGSIEINPIPYGEAGVSLRSLPVPEN